MITKPHKRSCLSILCLLAGHDFPDEPFWAKFDDEVGYKKELFHCRRCGCFASPYLLAPAKWPSVCQIENSSGLTLGELEYQRYLIEQEAENTWK